MNLYALKGGWHKDQTQIRLPRLRRLSSLVEANSHVTMKDSQSLVEAAVTNTKGQRIDHQGRKQQQ